jgi:ABC-type polysaccharide/polyol phosphate export permease
MFKELIKYRDLLLMLTLRDIKVRYKQAAMGFLWAIFMPIMAVLSGILVKKAISIVSGQPMDLKSIISISVKILPWTFFVSAIKFSVQSLVGNANLVTKIYFPKAVLPLSSVLACLFDFIIACLALSVFLIIVHIGTSIYILWLPLILFFLILFTSGLGLLLASANLFFRDVKYIVEIILMFGIFLTPVFYDASIFGKWKTLLLLNPVGGLLEAISNVIVWHRMPDIMWFAYAGLVSILTFIMGMLFFNRTEHLFAENI